MIKVNLKEAEGSLGRLIGEAAAGQEVVIVDASGRAVRLMPIAPEEPGTGKKVGHALDRFLGTWTAEEEAGFLKAVEVFEQVEESFWGLSEEPCSPTLEGLLGRVTEENLHQEVETGPAVGKEADATEDQSG